MADPLYEAIVAADPRAVVAALRELDEPARRPFAPTFLRVPSDARRSSSWTRADGQPLGRATLAAR